MFEFIWFLGWAAVAGAAYLLGASQWLIILFLVIGGASVVFLFDD